MRIEEKYRSLMQEAKMDPPEALWEEISTDLDLNAVWTDLSSSMDYAQTSWYEAFSGVSTLISFVAITLIIAYTPIPFTGSLTPVAVEVPDNIGGSRSETSVEPSIERSEVSIPDGSRSDEDMPGTPTDSGSDFQRGTEASMALNNENTPGAATRDISDEISYDRFRIALSPRSFQILPSPLRMEMAVIAGQTPGDSDPSSITVDSQKQRPSDKASIYAGVLGSMKNTWLVNDKTISGFRPTELHTTQAILGNEFGIMTGLTTDRYLMQLEYYFNSSYAQGYQEYVAGRYVDRSLEVGYHKLAYVLGIGKASSSSQLGSGHFLIGIYGGLLKHARENTSGNQVDLSRNYKKGLLGVKLGYQQSVALAQNLTATGGIRLDYGVSNIYKGTPLIPASFRITHPAAVHLSISLRYHTTRLVARDKLD